MGGAVIHEWEESTLIIWKIPASLFIDQQSINRFVAARLRRSQYCEGWVESLFTSGRINYSRVGGDVIDERSEATSILQQQS